MEFQLSNEENESTSAAGNDSSGSRASASSYTSDFMDDTFDPAAEDTVFIANRYNNSSPVNPTSSAATILSEQESFLPILMFVGAFLQILAFVSMILQLRSPALDLNNIGALQSSLSSVSVLSFLGSACILADAIILYKKKISGFSIIVWAIIFPFVYYFKRCKTGGPSSLFAFLIVAAQLILTFFTVNTTIDATFSAMGIKMNDSGIYGASMASSRVTLLPVYGITVEGMGSYYYDRIIDSNIDNPTYEYIAATSSEPALFSVQGTTPGSEETIIINFNYNTMEIKSITIGDETSSSTTDLYYTLFSLLKNTPSGPSSQSTMTQ